MAAASRVPKIVLRALHKDYDDRTTGRAVAALRGLNLTVGAEEFVCLIGPSGCGKSTLLYILGGFVPPTSGEVLIDGRPVGPPGPDRGIVFQEYALFPWLTVLENIMYGIRSEKTRGLRRLRAEQLIAKVHLTGFEHHYPRNLSGGMKQRVAIARALAHDPDILLADEPFGALDTQTRSLMQEELLRIWESDRKTIVFVTHSVDEAVYLADRVVVMTARPGTVKADIAVPLSRPRNFDVLMQAPEAMALRAELWRLVKEEVLRAGYGA
jgi:ABC-type nitrate/sulfonate/bicarbonate transport system ATPase subunit